MKAKLTEHRRKRTNKNKRTHTHTYTYILYTSVRVNACIIIFHFFCLVDARTIHLIIFGCQTNKKNVHKQRENRMIFGSFGQKYFSRIIFLLLNDCYWMLYAQCWMTILFSDSSKLCSCVMNSVYWHRFVCRVRKSLLIAHQNYIISYMNIGNSSNGKKRTFAHKYLWCRFFFLMGWQRLV